MISKVNARKIMSEKGLAIGDAVLIMVAAKEQNGMSRLNRIITKERVWGLMWDILMKIKDEYGGDYNMKDNITTRIIGEKILREFCKK